MDELKGISMEQHKDNMKYTEKEQIIHGQKVIVKVYTPSKVSESPYRNEVRLDIYSKLGLQKGASK